MTSSSFPSLLLLRAALIAGSASLLTGCFTEIADLDSLQGGSTGPIIEQVDQPLSAPYQYTGSGEGSLVDKTMNEFLAIDETRTYGSEFSATVSRIDNQCWELSVQYDGSNTGASQRQDSWTFCGTSEAELYKQRDIQSQRWSLQLLPLTTNERLNCADLRPNNKGLGAPIVTLDMIEDEPVDFACAGTNDGASGQAFAAGQMTYIGDEKWTIDGQDETVLHFKETKTLTGASEGSWQGEWWFRQSDLLPVSHKHSYDFQLVSGDLESAELQFTETIEFTLEGASKN